MFCESNGRALCDIAGKVIKDVQVLQHVVTVMQGGFMHVPWLVDDQLTDSGAAVIQMSCSITVCRKMEMYNKIPWLLDCSSLKLPLEGLLSPLSTSTWAGVLIINKPRHMHKPTLSNGSTSACLILVITSGLPHEVETSPDRLIFLTA
jgi:hypothetical protein